MTGDWSPGAGGGESRNDDRKRQVVWGVVAAVALIVAWLIGRSVIPRWWARRLGNFVDDSFTVGSITGIALGALFTFLPLLVLWAGFRFRRGWKRALAFVVAALLVASPLLATASIVWGNGNAAHAGERILDVNAPGVRGGTLIGVIVGALAFAGILYLAVSRGMNRRRATRYRDELRDRDETATQPGS